MVEKRLMGYITKMMYLIGSMLLLIGLLLSVLNIPVSAASGAIWTTNEGCDTPAAQDDNLYAVGETVHIRGSNFDSNAALDWTINGQPGSATPGLIASGSGTTDGTGYFCLAAHIIQPGEDGTYTVDVFIGNTKKNDNYRVNGILPAPLLTLVKTATPQTYSTVGAVISYSYLLTNDGNVPLDAPYTVTDDKATVTCPVTPNPLPAGSSVTCTATYVITQVDLDAGEVTNIAVGHAAYAGTAVNSNTDNETVTAAQTPALTLVKTAAPPTYDTVSDVVSYSYLLTNSGNVTLVAPFTVDDDKATVTCPATPTSLAPFASITCTASYTITQDDLDTGSVTNTATGYGYFGALQITSNPDDETVTAIPDADLTLDKTVNPASYSIIGTVLNYSYKLTNSGNVTLYAPFTVDDDKVTVTCPSTPTSLAPTDSITCSASHTITQADIDAGSITNNATGHGQDSDANTVDSNPDSEFVPAQVQGPALQLDKTVVPATYSAVGQVLSYSYELANIGDVTLTGFTVTDNKVTVNCSAALTTLLPGESTTCAASYTITQADIDAGSVTNTATAHGQGPTGAPVDSNPDTETATTESSAVLTLVKTVDPTTYSSVGDVLNYNYLLTNGGNVTLTGFTVDDDKATVTCPSTPTSLAPGESITCEASYTITQADIDAGSVTNIAMGHAVDPEQSPVDSNEDTETATNEPQFTWQFQAQDTPSCAVYPGTQCVTFLVTLTNIPPGEQVVLDTQFLGPDAPTINVGESYIFSQDGEFVIEVCAPWPGIGFGLVDVGVNIQGMLSLQGEGDPQLLDELTALVYYDTDTMREQCQPPAQELVLLDPYCTEISTGNWGMTWAVENLSDFEIIFVWQITGENPLGDAAPAASQYVLDTVPLGSYTVSIFWGESQVDSLSAVLQLSDCEAPPPPTATPTPTATTPPTGPTDPPPSVPTTPPIFTPTPEPTIPAPESVTEGEVLIPVTGLDMSAFLTLFGPFRKAIFLTGLAFIGMAFIFQGVRSRFRR